LRLLRQVGPPFAAKTGGISGGQIPGDIWARFYPAAAADLRTRAKCSDCQAEPRQLGRTLTQQSVAIQFRAAVRPGIRRGANNTLLGKGTARRRPRQPSSSMLVCPDGQAHSIHRAAIGSTLLLTRRVHRGTRAGQRNGALSSDPRCAGLLRAAEGRERGE
jgi:hypothetical protein